MQNDNTAHSADDARRIDEYLTANGGKTTDARGRAWAAKKLGIAGGATEAKGRETIKRQSREAERHQRSMDSRGYGRYGTRRGRRTW